MQSKTTEYFSAIQCHVVSPLENSTIAEHCFAAALLVFGAIDGLGRLIHTDREASPGDRFKAYLQRLGEVYVAHADAIWKLRNSLAHNAVNVAAFMSKAEGAELHHLEEDRGRIFVHTRVLAKDFTTSFNALSEELEQNQALATCVENRLDYAELTDPSWRKMEVKTTEPPPIRFVQGPAGGLG
ncbi:MAG: hypothetical protein WD065_06725 [Planctomycetaceae bacterium]